MFRIILFLLIFSLFSCNKITGKFDKGGDSNGLSNEENIFSKDELLRDLYDALNERDRNRLLRYMDFDDSLYKVRALYAWASLGDTTHFYDIVQMLSDSSRSVRLAAAFTIGFMKRPYAEDFLIKQYYNESDIQVRGAILEAIGSCGKKQGLRFLSHIEIPFSKKYEPELLGLAYGLARYSIRRITDNYSDNKAIELLKCNTCSDKVKQVISFYFLSPTVEVQRYYKSLLNVYQLSNDRYLKINLLKALSKVQNQEVFQLILNELNSSDELIRIAAVEALYNQKNPRVSRTMIKLLNDKNSKVATLAAQYFIYNGLKSEASYYFEVAKVINNWHSRSLMFQAALKYADDTLRPKIIHSIKSGYKVTENIYEKANLLSALSYVPTEYEFVRDQTFYSGSKVISTTGIKTLVKMRYHPEFAHFAKMAKEQNGDNLYREFALIFKEAMRRGDNAMIFYSANILKNKRLGMITELDNTYFINQALVSLQLPRDLRVYRSVCELMKMYTGVECNDSAISMTPINWQLVKRLNPRQQVIVKTSKGDFVIELNVEMAPAAVSSFVQMILDNYYNHTYVYKVLSGRVVMASSRRGDGWQDQNIAHPITVYPAHFEAGSVGFQLIDNRIESVQWFISLRPSPQLDGKYTLIGKVVKGLDVVERLDVSDEILAIELY